MKSARIMKKGDAVADIQRESRDDTMRTIENIIATLDHIESHLDEPLTLETVADELGYSRYHLHRMFTRTVGITIHAYIRRRQLTEAAGRLGFQRRRSLISPFRPGAKVSRHSRRSSN